MEQDSQSECCGHLALGRVPSSSDSMKPIFMAPEASMPESSSSPSTCEVASCNPPLWPALSKLIPANIFPPGGSLSRQQEAAWASTESPPVGPASPSRLWLPLKTCPQPHGVDFRARSSFRSRSPDGSRDLSQDPIRRSISPWGLLKASSLAPGNSCFSGLMSG